MSSKNSPSFNLKNEEASFAPVPAAEAAIGSATESETKNNTSYFSGLAAAFASVARAAINVFTSIGAWLYDAAQSFGFFQDTNAENVSGASTPVVATTGQDGNADEHSPAPSSSYGSMHALSEPVTPAATAAVTKTPPASPTALTKNSSNASLNADNRMFHDVESIQGAEAPPRSDSQNSQSSHMSNAL
jgi:hypothetical protein